MLTGPRLQLVAYTNLHLRFAGLSVTKNGSLVVIFAYMQGTGRNTRYFVKCYHCLASYTQPSGVNHGLGRLECSFYFLLSLLVPSWHDGEVYPSLWRGWIRNGRCDICGYCQVDPTWIGKLSRQWLRSVISVNKSKLVAVQDGFFKGCWGVRIWSKTCPLRGTSVPNFDVSKDHH